MTRLLYIGSFGPTCSLARTEAANSGVINPPQSSITTPGHAIGVADPNRHVHVLVIGGSWPLLSATIAGIPATVLQSPFSVSGYTGIRMFHAPVPLGMTAAFNMQFDVTGPSAQNFSFHTFRSIWRGTTHFAEEESLTTFSGNGNLSWNVQMKKGGFYIGGLLNSFHTGDSFTGVDNADNNGTSGPYKYAMWGETPITENRGQNYAITTGAGGTNQIWQNVWSFR